MDCLNPGTGDLADLLDGALEAEDEEGAHIEAAKLAGDGAVVAGVDPLHDLAVLHTRHTLVEHGHPDTALHIEADAIRDAFEFNINLAVAEAAIGTDGKAGQAVGKALPHHQTPPQP